MNMDVGTLRHLWNQKYRMTVHQYKSSERSFETLYSSEAIPFLGSLRSQDKEPGTSRGGERGRRPYLGNVHLGRATKGRVNPSSF